MEPVKGLYLDKRRLVEHGFEWFLEQRVKDVTLYRLQTCPASLDKVHGDDRRLHYGTGDLLVHNTGHKQNNRFE